MGSFAWPLSLTPATAVLDAPFAIPIHPADDPLVDLDNAVIRLRATAWRASTAPGRTVGIPMLIQLATVAVELHGTTALLRARLTRTSRELQKAGIPAKPLLEKAECWRQIRARLLRLDSPAVLNPTLNNDVQIARRRLAELRREQPAPAHPGLAGSPGAQRHPRSPADLGAEKDQLQTLQSLLRVSAAFTEISRWNLTTLQYLRSTHQIYLPNPGRS